MSPECEIDALLRPQRFDDLDTFLLASQLSPRALNRDAPRYPFWARGRVLRHCVVSLRVSAYRQSSRCALQIRRNTESHLSPLPSAACEHGKARQYGGEATPASLGNNPVRPEGAETPGNADLYASAAARSNRTITVARSHRGVIRQLRCRQKVAKDHLTQLRGVIASVTLAQRLLGSRAYSLRARIRQTTTPSTSAFGLVSFRRLRVMARREGNNRGGLRCRTTTRGRTNGTATNGRSQTGAI